MYNLIKKITSLSSLISKAHLDHSSTEKINAE